MGENARFKNGDARVETRVLKTLACRMVFGPMVDSVSVRFKNARVEKVPLNIRIQWNAGTACVSGCVLKTLACRGLRVGPSKCEAILPFPCYCVFVLVWEVRGGLGLAGPHLT